MEALAGRIQFAERVRGVEGENRGVAELLQRRPRKSADLRVVLDNQDAETLAGTFLLLAAMVVAFAFFG